jgi:3-methylfumaryl-CoA hydratase
MGEWDAWIGRETMANDVLTKGLVDRFCAAIESDNSIGLHWCLCLPDAPTARLGPDGHPQRGADLPPIALPRRMWAASHVQFHRPLLAGAAITRRSVITAITAKRGATGPLIFVEIDHATHCDARLAVREQQTLVYREAGGAAAAPAPPTAGTGAGAAAQHWDWQRAITPDAPLLFRYSALTFNSHRIHYDLPYATAAEGYRGLVVQGPLLATLLLDLAANAVGAQRIASLSFRGVMPAIAGEPLHLCGRADGDTLVLSARNAAGLVMAAQIGLKPA